MSLYVDEIDLDMVKINVKNMNNKSQRRKLIQLIFMI